MDGGAAAGRATERQCTVLLVDDNGDSREMYAFYLRAADYLVHEAADGRDALGIALDCRPDVIVMDLSLPLVDGFTAIERLANNPDTASIPIVVLSASAFPTDEKRARDAGAAAFLTKPCAPDELARTVRHLSERCEASFAPASRSSRTEAPAV